MNVGMWITHFKMWITHYFDLKSTFFECLPNIYFGYTGFKNKNLLKMLLYKHPKNVMIIYISLKNIKLG
jgi:hypothetical protein